MAGTPEWEQAGDRVKVAALFDAARHWALRVETSQAAMAEAGSAISAAADWPAISRQFKRGNIYIPRVVTA